MSPRDRARLDGEAHAFREGTLTPRAGTFEWDRRSGAVSWSPGLERMHGLQPGSFGGTFDYFIADAHPEDRAGVVGAIEQALQNPEHPFRIEYRIVRPDGSMRWVEAHGEMVLGDSDVVGIRGVCIDVSAERALGC